MRLRIDPDAIVAAARAGWPKAAPIAESRRPVAAPASPDAGLAAHAAAIEAALTELRSAADIRGSRLEVTIASALLHLDVAEGDFGAQGDRQLQGIATACVTEMLGDQAAEQAVRWHLQDDDRHLLIVAIAQAWIDLLQAAAASAGLRLARVEPEFIARWNAAGRTMGSGNGVFAVCGSGDVAIAAVADGAIAAISIGAGVDLRSEAAGTRAAPGAPRPGRVVASGFSPDRQGMAIVDDRVDRFLSGRGQDPERQSAFVLVPPDDLPVAASKRWSVAGLRETRP